MAVLPVCRSPMISSRWPRPMGIMASIALIPVCRGSCTFFRSTTPGALASIGRNRSVLIGPLPSRGWPKRVDDATDQRLAHGHLHDPARPLDAVALLISL